MKRSLKSTMKKRRMKRRRLDLRSDGAELAVFGASGPSRCQTAQTPSSEVLPEDAERRSVSAPHQVHSTSGQQSAEPWCCWSTGVRKEPRTGENTLGVHGVGVFPCLLLARLSAGITLYWQLQDGDISLGDSGGQGRKVFEERCHQGRLSLRKVVCTCGVSLWHPDKLRGLSQSKGGQQEPAFPSRAPARGRGWKSGSKLKEMLRGRRVSTPAWTLAASGWAVGAKLCTVVGSGGCLVIWGGGRGTSLALAVGLAGPFRCFLLHSVLLCSVGLCLGLLSARLWYLGKAGPGLSILTHSLLSWPDFFSLGQSSGFCPLSTVLVCSLVFYLSDEENFPNIQDNAV